MPMAQGRAATNLRMALPSLVMALAYPRTIERSVAMDLALGQSAKVDCPAITGKIDAIATIPAVRTWNARDREEAAVLPWEAAYETEALLPLPYFPHDRADHNDPAAALHLCARCDREPEIPGSYHRRETYRR